MSTIDHGIDLGTTNSAVCLQDGRASQLIPGPEGELLPSAVHVRADGEVVVGQRARARLADQSLDTAIEFKRLMGTSEKRRFPASGRELSPVELSAEVLRVLCDWARARSGEPLRAAVITVPAMFQLPQCDATREAAHLAGIEHAVLLQEPIAAAIAHTGAGQVRDGSWLVYDLGGGTFDVSLVRCKAGRLQVLDHDGDNHLGGRDFDRAIARKAVALVRETGALGEFKRTDPANDEAFARIKVEAERVRIALSAADSVRFEVEGLGGHASIRFDLDRPQLEELLAPLITRTTALCNKLLHRNRVALSELSGLVMVGGPTLTPCVARQIHNDVGVEARHHVDPMTIVARGAALFASTQRLPAALRRQRASAAIELQLEYEATTTNPAPLVVGKVAAPVPPPPGLQIEIARDDGEFRTASSPAADGVFATDLRLIPNALNVFRIRVLDRARAGLSVDPESFKVLHGFSIARPPLSQSVGIMLADNTVHWYLRKGAALPARQTVSHVTTLALRRGQSGEAVHVPMVQGESSRADRNKVIGMLQIHADRIARDLPEGSSVEVTLSIDESAHTAGRAYVPALDQWFEEVVRFELEAKPAAEIDRSLANQRDRLNALEQLADQLGGEPVDHDERIQEVEALLEEGDRDSIDLADQMVRMISIDLDAAEDGGRKTRLATHFAEARQDASEVIHGDGKQADSGHGRPSEQRELSVLAAECEHALARGDLDLAERKIEDLRSLRSAVMMRQPEFWIGFFEYLVEQAKKLGLSAAVATHVDRGRRAIREKNWDTLTEVCRDILETFPSDERDRVSSPIRSNVV